MINFFDTNKNNLPKQVKINTAEIEALKASVKITPKGEYDAETEYKRFDLVVASDNNTYICIADAGVEIVGQDPTTSAYWTLYAKHGEKGETGENGTDGTDGEDGKRGSMWWTTAEALNTTPGQTTTINKTDIIEYTSPNVFNQLDMVLSSNGMCGAIITVGTTTLTITSFANIKGAKGDPGQDAPTYTAGTGIQITDGVISTDRMENPMTSAGDLIYGGPSGTPTALPIGQPGQIPAVNQSGTGFEFVNQQSGGGQLYQHNFTLLMPSSSDVPSTALITVIITNETSTPMTVATLARYLFNNNFREVAYSYPTSNSTFVDSNNKNNLFQTYCCFSYNEVGVYVQLVKLVYEIINGNIEITRSTIQSGACSTLYRDQVVAL